MPAGHGGRRKKKMDRKPPPPLGSNPRRCRKESPGYNSTGRRKSLRLFPPPALRRRRRYGGGEFLFSTQSVLSPAPLFGVHLSWLCAPPPLFSCDGEREGKAGGPKITRRGGQVRGRGAGVKGGRSPECASPPPFSSLFKIPPERRPTQRLLSSSRSYVRGRARRRMRRRMRRRTGTALLVRSLGLHNIGQNTPKVNNNCTEEKNRDFQERVR